MSTTTRVSVASNGSESNDGNIAPALSGDGRYVVFRSAASNLVPGDTNSQDDIFLHDRQSGTTTRVSISTINTQGNNMSDNPTINRDGHYIAFVSSADNLVAGDNNGRWDIFLRDRLNNTS